MSYNGEVVGSSNVIGERLRVQRTPARRARREVGRDERVGEMGETGGREKLGAYSSKKG